MYMGVCMCIINSIDGSLAESLPDEDVQSQGGRGIGYVTKYRII